MSDPILQKTHGIIGSLLLYQEHCQRAMSIHIVGIAFQAQVIIGFSLGKLRWIVVYESLAMIKIRHVVVTIRIGGVRLD